MQEALKWYEEAHTFQMKVFGKYHYRTKQITEDVRGIREWLDKEEGKALAGNASKKVIQEEGAGQSQSQSHEQLMLDFLAARRSELRDSEGLPRAAGKKEQSLPSLSPSSIAEHVLVPPAQRGSKEEGGKPAASSKGNTRKRAGEKAGRT